MGLKPYGHVRCNRSDLAYRGWLRNARDHIGEDAIVFAKTQSPHDNATIAIQEYIDVHANAFHAHQAMDFNIVHFGHVDEATSPLTEYGSPRCRNHVSEHIP